MTLDEQKEMIEIIHDLKKLVGEAKNYLVLAKDSIKYVQELGSEYLRRHLTTNLMDQVEARRRFEKKLVLRGYSMTGIWTKKYHDQEERENIYSMALNGMDNVRAVLWPMGKSSTEAGEWIAMISIAVGEDGEFPLTGDIITRHNSNVWQLATFKSMVKRIDYVRTQVRRWDTEEFLSLQGMNAMMRLSLDYIRQNRITKAKGILLGTLRGELHSATISEALSITQLRWATSREERLISAKIWSKIFK